MPKKLGERMKFGTQTDYDLDSQGRKMPSERLLTDTIRSQTTQIMALRKRCGDLQLENSRYREVIEYYATANSDNGDKARDALNPPKEVVP